MCDFYCNDPNCQEEHEYELECTAERRICKEMTTPEEDDNADTNYLKMPERDE